MLCKQPTKGKLMSTEYELSSEQMSFINEAEEQGHSVEYSYSGKYMNGRKCPAVFVDSLKDMRARGKSVQWDKVGSKFVIYCPQ
jgi:hypothetical protein